MYQQLAYMPAPYASTVSIAREFSISESPSSVGSSRRGGYRPCNKIRRCSHAVRHGLGWDRRNDPMLILSQKKRV